MKQGQKLYDFKCKACEKVEERFALFEERSHTCKKCGGEAERMFPMNAIKSFVPFDAYYDEALDCDITGHRHKKDVMNALDVHEAGDRKHGGRNWDSDNPTAIRPSPKLRGKKIDDIHRKKDVMEKAKDSFTYDDE